MRPTISLLILPTRTISTISTVSSSVTRMPPTKRGSLPRRFINAPICGPPPCTITGLMPTRRSRMTSRANGCLRSACSIAAPPYLMTTVLPRNSRMYGSASIRISARRRASSITGSPSQDVPREVLVAGELAQARVNVTGVDRQLLAGQVGSVERDLVQELLHDRVEAPGPDVLGRRVHPHGDLGERVDRIRRESQCHALRAQQLDVLPDQRVPGFRQDADEILARQGVELDADGEAPLQLRDEIRRLGHVKRAGRDEQDVIRPHDPVLRRDSRPLDDRQQIALHALAAHIGAVSALAPGHLVELVEEHDAGILDPADGLADGLFGV